MLWRDRYETRVLRDLELPDPLSGLFVGGFDLRAQSEVGIWRRLFDEAGLVPTVVWIQPEWTPTARRNVLASTAPSLQADLRLLDDPADRWRALLAPDRPERSFALLAQDGVARLAMVGAPTEEAWDLFRSEAYSIA